MTTNLIEAAEKALEALNCHAGNYKLTKSECKELNRVTDDLTTAIEGRAAMDKHDETFARWFCRECPPGTVISSPEWWAAKIEFRLRTEWGKEQGLTRHEFYKDGDKDVPEQIKDRNGQVVLTLCKLCNQAKGEIESDYCPQPTESRAEIEAKAFDDAADYCENRAKLSYLSVEQRIANWMRNHANAIRAGKPSAQNGKQASEVERDAARWRYLKSATGETPLRPAAYGAEFPDIRLRFDFPTIVSYDAVGNQIELDDAIDAAIAALAAGGAESGGAE